MCSPVMAKNVAPKSGDGGVPSVVVKASTHFCGRKNGRRPSPIKCFHSNKCSTTKVSPSRIAARIYLRGAALSPRVDAETPKTIVKLEDNRQKVITEEKMILGLKGKGVGHTFEA